MSDYVLFLVDDDLDDQVIFQEALKSINLPFICQTARDGIFAQELMQTSTFLLPDIIFLDLNMPRMNGRELLKVIRGKATYHQVPIVVYSTSSSPEDINQCLALGANTYLTKHNSFNQLCQDLRRLLHEYVPALSQPS